MTANCITIHTDLDEKTYRSYMNFHVFKKDRGWLVQLLLCLVIFIFGLMNYQVHSPILGTVFVLLSLYLLITRFLRFYISLNRICETYGLSDKPKHFYTLVVSDAGLRVSNQTENTVYQWEQVYHAYCFPHMIYLYMNRSTAFLLPDTRMEGGTEAELREIIKKHLPEERLTLKGELS